MEPVTRMLMGDEAVAHAAAHAGISAAYAYPGTPSTEILECLLEMQKKQGSPKAAWCANEKTAYEAALGMSMAGMRTLVSMKHVGLNVAADPFMNSAVVQPVGGLVVAVADDPGMHSSQNEQDSRYYADFARVPCLEPADPQEAYDMVRDAYDLSEAFRIPVLVRLVTRLAHQRSGVRLQPDRRGNDAEVTPDRDDWVLLPAYARKLWKRRLIDAPELRRWAEESKYNTLSLNEEFPELGVITTGISKHYFLELTSEVGLSPSHLHIGAYPMPMEKTRKLVDHCGEILVIEEGYPHVERMLRGIVPPSIAIRGRMDGTIPEDGEMSQDLIRRALGLPVGEGVQLASMELPGRPPRLCEGCPHTDAYDALRIALEGHERPIVMSDIGCYTLGILPPHRVGDSCVCMGASIGMAKGAADAGVHPSIAIIGDSTFLHSGVTPLMDAVSGNADMLLVILDNQTVAMTGTQPTLLPSERIHELILGLGVDPEHCHKFEVHPRKVGELAELFRREISHPGLSVVIAHRECIEAARRNKKN
ncbi:MAG: indolepyruvate ferredoxin oxidoreductase [Acidobacteria bacterium]|nr:indolepyruvate ferredoxin oxidoreductase [Acidobacteriota bacterium]